MKRFGHAARVLCLLPAGLVLILTIVVVPGCGVNDPPASGPAEQALSDPFNYQPHVQKNNSVSGGDTGQFDKKGFMKDLNDVFNP